MIINRRKLLQGLAVVSCSPALPASAGEQFYVNRNDETAVPYKYRRRDVEFETTEPVGTIVVDTQKFYLYFVEGHGKAIRYGIGVGRSGARWSGEAKVVRKAKWPKWTPTAEMLQTHVLYRRWVDGMPGGPDNPLGARAIYLLNDGVDNQVRIHGTPAPESIGKAATAGCFRMTNVDVVELYDKVAVGTRVVVMPRVASKRTSLFGPVE